METSFCTEVMFRLVDKELLVSFCITVQAAGQYVCIWHATYEVLRGQQ